MSKYILRVGHGVGYSNLFEDVGFRQEMNFQALLYFYGGTHSSVSLDQAESEERSATMSVT